MEDRGYLRTAPPFARFRCLICKEFVVGTAAGHCPKCGFVPPSAPAPVEAAASSRAPALLVLVVLASILIAVLAR